MLVAALVLFGVMIAGCNVRSSSPTTTPSGSSAPPALTSPRQINERDALVALARLLGYVHYFHPSDEAAEVDWNAFTIWAVERVHGSLTLDQVVRALREVVAPVAPSVIVFVEGESSDRVYHRPVDAKWVVGWEHRGFDGVVADSFRSSREYWGIGDAGAPDPSLSFTADLGDGLWASIPLAVYAGEAGTLPAPAVAVPSLPSTPLSDTGLAARIGAVIEIWNVFQHFYPYWDVVDRDWEVALEVALVETLAEPETALEFDDVLRRMVAKTNDGHASVNPLVGASRSFAPPVMWDWVEESLVITYVSSADLGISVGDVVLAVDRVPAAAAIAEAETLVAAATVAARRHRALDQLLRGVHNSEIELSVRSQDGSIHTVTLTRDGFLADWNNEPRPGAISELAPGVMYVDLTRVAEWDFGLVIPELLDVQALIFDMRGYVAGTGLFVRYLIDEPTATPPLLRPIYRYPDQIDVTFEDVTWTIHPATPHLAVPVVAFLADERAISAPETELAVVKAEELGTIVGESTAGTNGTVMSALVTGGYLVRFTGLRVDGPDGGVHHGVGIVPDVWVERTIEGVAAGRDEILERALAIVTDSNNRKLRQIRFPAPMPAPVLAPIVSTVPRVRDDHG